jgi:hypothetical protein
MVTPSWCVEGGFLLVQGEASREEGTEAEMCNPCRQLVTCSAIALHVKKLD